MLSAGVITCFSCIIQKMPIQDMLIRVLIVLVIFYIIGWIVGKYISRINQTANDAYILAERERMKAEKEKKEQDEQEALENGTQAKQVQEEKKDVV